jgi:hypothetical protein
MNLEAISAVSVKYKMIKVNSVREEIVVQWAQLCLSHLK